jgi:undecaprenyl-diphosphatase
MLNLIIEAIILGIVQGATEFIPISSSAHLIIIPWLAGWNDPVLTSLPFDVALHLGTLVAVLVCFASDWVRYFHAGIASIKERRIASDPDRKLAWFIIIGTIPGAIIGALAESKIEELFHKPGSPIQTEVLIIMAIIIAVMAVLLLLADRLAQHQENLQALTLKQTILIGLAQALSIFPGVSRSGSTITAGLALGLKRDAAAKFSFLLSAPVIAGAGMKSLYDLYQGSRVGVYGASDLAIFIVGFVSAAVIGYLCIRFLIRYLQNHTVNVFVYYRLFLAVLVLIVALNR